MATSKLVGQRFGKLVVLDALEPHMTDAGGYVQRFKVRCDCGSVYEVYGSSLRGGSRQCNSCRKKGYAARSAVGYKHPLYRLWWGMITRCRDTGSTSYADYGGRGIQVCDRWVGDTSKVGTMEGFRAFLEDMAPRPPGMSLGRIDNDESYSPDNCRWETPEQQMNNTRANVIVTVDGVTMTLTQWSRKLGVAAGKIRGPHSIHGIPLETILRKLLSMDDRSRYIAWVDRLTPPKKAGPPAHLHYNALLQSVGDELVLQQLVDTPHSDH